MGRIVYLGDALAAAGFRLAGIEARAVPRGEGGAAVAEVVADATLLMVSAALAGELSAAELARLRAALTPQFLVLPDSATGIEAVDPLGGIAARLGADT